MVRPRYPKGDLYASQDVLVELQVVIAADGKIIEMQPRNEDSPFIDASVRAVRRWRFYPIEVEGHPVETTYRVSIHFNSLLHEAVPSAIELASPRHVPHAVFPEKSDGETVHRVSESGIVPPKALYSPEPERSEISQKNREQGTVAIAVVVDSSGRPRDLQVRCSSIPDSDQNAVEAVKQWKFSPAMKDGIPVAFAIEVDVAFSNR